MVAVAIAMVMVISLLLVRRKPYGTISHGIVEVRVQLTGCRNGLFLKQYVQEMGSNPDVTTASGCVCGF